MQYRLLFNTMKILFWFRKLGDNKGSICCRITVNGIRGKDFATGIICEASKWDASKKKVIGDNFANTHLQTIQYKLHMTMIELENKNIKATPEQLLKGYNGETTNYSIKEALLALKEHIQEKETAGIISYETLYNDFNKIKNLTSYFKLKKLLEKDIEEFSTRDANDFILWAKSQKFKSSEFISRHISVLKKAFNLAYQDKKIKSDPLANFKIILFSKPENITFLELEEIEKLKNITLVSTLDRIRDAFLLQCYTGLDYGCLLTFNEGCIRERNLRKWIEKAREKNGAIAMAPLLPEAERILEKYEYKVPVISNQKYNSYLKEVGKRAGIEKNLTTHIGRKTFGSLMLQRGFSIEAVSKMLGHADIRTTQRHYARVTDKRVEMEVAKLLG